MRSYTRLAAPLVGLLVIAAGVGTVWACSVPVFRYALERWPADPYLVYVFHRGELPAEANAALDRLKNASVVKRPDGVVDLWVTDLAKGEPEDLAAEVWKKYGEKGDPLIVVQYPRMIGMPVEVFWGPLTDETVTLLLDSPKRRMVAKRLLEGDITVFVMVDSGNAAKDDATEKLLKEELARMEKLIELPEVEDGQWDDPVYDSEGAPNLKIAFSVVRLSRKDPVERAFLDMLLGCEPDLKNEAEPVVFPIFGRGRLLCALVGDGIGRENIEEICAFLTAPCSCQVKYQNPGVDMLMDVHWDEALAGEPSAIPEVAVPELTGLAKFAAAAGVGENAPPEAGAGEADAETPACSWAAVASRPVVIGSAAGVAGLAIVALVSMVIWKRGKRAEV